MSEKKYRHIQCKCRAGISCRWHLGKTKDGKFKAMGVRSATRRVPSAFLPFEVTNAVLGGGAPRFHTLDEAEMYVRSL